MAAKKITIIGADFEDNAVNIQTTWYITQATDYGSSATYTPTLANGGWAFGNSAQTSLRGKTFNTFKFKPYGSGTLNIYKATALDGTSTLLTSITISANESGTWVTKITPSVTLGSAEFLVVGEANSQVGMYYAKNASGTGFYSKVPSGSYATVTEQSLCFDIGLTTY